MCINKWERNGIKKEVIPCFTILGASFLIGFLGVAGLIEKEMNRSFVSLERDIKKLKKEYEILFQWVMLRQRKLTLAEYFRENKYENVGIVGNNILANTLMKELKKEDIACTSVTDYKIDNTVDVFVTIDDLPNERNYHKIENWNGKNIVPLSIIVSEMW